MKTIEKLEKEIVKLRQLIHELMDAELHQRDSTQLDAKHLEVGGKVIVCLEAWGVHGRIYKPTHWRLLSKDRLTGKILLGPITWEEE